MPFRLSCFIALTSLFISSAASLGAVNAEDIASVAASTAFTIRTTLNEVASIAVGNTIDRSQVIYFPGEGGSNEQWIFNSVGLSGSTFTIENVGIPGAFLAPAIGTTGDIEGSQLVISLTSRPVFTINAIVIGQPGVNIFGPDITDCLTTWPGLINQGPITFQKFTGGTGAFGATQNFTIVPV